MYTYKFEYDTLPLIGGCLFKKAKSGSRLLGSNSGSTTPSFNFCVSLLNYFKMRMEMTSVFSLDAWVFPWMHKQSRNSSYCLKQRKYKTHYSSPVGILRAVKVTAQFCSLGLFLPCSNLFSFRNR